MTAMRGRRRIPPVAFEETHAREVPGEPWRREPVLGPVKRAIHEALRRLPVGFAPRLAHALAPLIRHLERRRIYARRLVWTLARLHPDAPLAAAELAAAVRRWWRQAGAVMAEYATVERLRAAGRLEVDDPHGTLAGLPADAPVVFACVHLGPFELCFETVLNTFGREAVGTWQPEPSPAANRILHEMRARYGLYVFPPGQRSARHLHRLVVGDGFDAILFVDEVRERQIHLPAFGRPLPLRGNASIAIKLALKTGAPVVPIHVLRTGPARYRVHVGVPLAFERGGAPSSATMAGIAALDRHFEPIVRHNLDQWYMLPELRLPDFDPAKV
ncbi:lysophospholipid acyltransferase family protein [Stappia sp. TSB10GB4]|uniref:lysophospholipid acyltransferase family protein n=1 Tax=Stappia sp. TSB10GB4 TaxID=2003584 RepID=UPI0016495AAC|nr:hypothetical protein [Stappia sp. TSB10GB4]